MGTPAKPTNRPSRARLVAQKVVMFDVETAAIISKRAARAKKSDGAIIRELVLLGLKAKAKKPVVATTARTPQPLA